MFEMSHLEVLFYKYCPLCKYNNVSQSNEPCNSCLSEPINFESHRPVNFEKRED